MKSFILLTFLIASSIAYGEVPEGWHQTPEGTVLHPSCFEYGSDKVIKETKGGFDKLVQHTLSTVSKCMTENSELTPYLSKWISALPKTVIFCGIKSRLKGPSGRAYRSAKDLKMRSAWGTKLSERRDIKKFMEKNSDYSSLVGFTDNFFGPELNTEFRIAHKFLIHEVLHNSDADNQSLMDHNLMFLSDFYPFCQRNASFDRIEVITHYCMDHSASLEELRELGKKYNVTKFKGDSYIDCAGGLESCVKIFTEKTARQGIESISLNEVAAKNICEKIIKKSEIDLTEDLAAYSKKLFSRPETCAPFSFGQIGP